MVSHRKLIVFICAAVAACSSPQPRSAGTTQNESFVIAGGQTITLPMTSAGPIPAENERAKILVAGFVVGPSKESEKKAVLAWGFDFETKQPFKLESVKVEEVFPSKSPQVLVEDTLPILNKGVWSGNAASIPTNRSATPWLYASDKSVYVFRFTIKPAGEPAFVLYQPTWFSSPTKQSFQKIIARVEHG